VLDDAQRKTIREWFQGLVRLREEGLSETASVGEEGRPRDLPIPRELAEDVTGGSASGSATPPDPPVEPDE
jgi:hypothetical protein